jgi:hypothetical protein
MRTRSPRWSTVHLSTDAFRRAVRPFSWYLNTGTKSTKDPMDPYEISAATAVIQI